MGRQTQWARKFISWNYKMYRVPTYQRAVDAHTTKAYISIGHNKWEKKYLWCPG